MTTTNRVAKTKVVEMVVQETASYDVRMRVPVDITEAELEEICRRVPTGLLAGLNCDVDWHKHFDGATFEYEEEAPYESLKQCEADLQNNLHLQMIRDGKRWKAKFYDPNINAVEEETL